MTTLIAQTDALRLPLADRSVDLVVCSPPYEDARSYGIDFALRGQAWVDWAVAGFRECLRVCRGLVAWVVEGRGSQTTSWSGVPALMMTDLIRSGVPIWKPPVYGRYSTPGRFKVLRNLYELVVCSSNGRSLDGWDPTAMGDTPKCKPGGRTRPRLKDGSRNLARLAYKQPKRTNAGNLIWCGAAGGGNIGSKLAHQNEAPFPEKLAEFFIRSFCPPGGTVLDPFYGSGTKAAVAVRHGRRAVAFDLRASQCRLTMRRVDEGAA